MESAVKRKVTVRPQLDNEASSSLRTTPHKHLSRPPSPSKLFTDPSLPVPLSRPASPTKLFTKSDHSLSVPRPKAKVNSAASIRKTASVGSSISSKSGKASNASTSTYRSGAKTNASTTPRAASPLKAPQSRNGASSPFKPVKARVTVHTAQLAATTSESRQRSLTTAASDTSLRNTGRRRGSISSHNTGSAVSIRPQTPSISPHDGSDSSQVGAVLRKVRSKVTGTVTHDFSSSLLPSPESNTCLTSSPRNRAPSISSSTSFFSTPSPSPDKNIFYPITTATAAANPHRFATTRASPPLIARHHYQPFPPKDDLFINYSRPTMVPKVDPAKIPLPPHSPPTSAVSFSSQSSRSRSSTSYQAENSGDSQSSFPTLGSPTTSIRRSSIEGSLGLRLTLHNGAAEPEDYTSAGEQGNDRESDLGLGGEERKIKAEAKSNRKIADLEITNRSLLAINTSLEAAKHQQAKEIRELRRKLRESRLMLPPRDYQAVKVSLGHDETGEEDEEDEEEGPKGKTGDESYRRITVMLERLIETGKRALEAKPENFLEGGKGGAKVLSAEEVRSWRDSGGDPEGQMKDGIHGDRPPTPSHITVPQNDGEFLSEEEVEAMALATDSARTSPASPPIHITASP